MRKIILTTGGTGGHIFPALATAEALRERLPDAELLFMGASYGPEKDMAAKAGIPFAGLPGRGILGRGFRAVPAAWDNLKAVAKAIAAVRSFGPSAVAAFGGYASFAPAVAAILLRIPLLLHEQNAVAGTSNRILAKWSRRVCLSLPHTQGIQGDCVLTGNPVRKGIALAAQRRIPGKKLFVLGGSQGAHALNAHVISILPALRAGGVEIMHQTGAKDIQTVRNAYAASGYNPDCAQAFIDDMTGAYGWADLILCRAGASTVAELCASELPAILVPFPAAIHNHQTLNARVMAEAGAAVLLPEPELQSSADMIMNMLSDRSLLNRMSRACASLARPDAAARVAAEIENLFACKADK